MEKLLSDRIKEFGCTKNNQGGQSKRDKRWISRKLIGHGGDRYNRMGHINRVMLDITRENEKQVRPRKVL